MANKFCKEELIQYKIKGQIRPFIDQNLQLQIPNLESTKSEGSSYTDLYSHYFNHINSLNDPILPVDKQEIEKAMLEARQSYEAWRKMQKKIEEAIAKHLC